MSSSLSPGALHQQQEEEDGGKNQLGTAGVRTKGQGSQKERRDSWDIGAWGELKCTLCHKCRWIAKLQTF